MSIAINANSASFSKSVNGATSYTFNHTSGGVDRYALVFAMDVSSGVLHNITGVTYDGTAMTNIAEATRGPSNTTTLSGYVFGLYAQSTTTSANITITRTTGGPHWIEGACVSLSGALQQITPDATVSFPGDSAGSSKTKSITTITDNDAVFVWLMNDNGGGFGSPTNITQLMNGATGGFVNASIVYKSNTFPYTPAGALSTSWTQNGTGSWWYIAVAIKQISGGGPTFIPKIIFF